MTDAEWLAEHARIRARQAQVAMRIADSLYLDPPTPPRAKWVEEYRRLDLLMIALCANAPAPMERSLR